MLHDDSSLHFKKLVVLVVTNCKLTGQMPSWLTKSTSLQLLDLSWNHLTGTIPNWFSSFTDLFYLDLSNNSFTGNIPKSLTRLQSLTVRSVSLDDFSQDFTSMYRMNENAGHLQYKHIVRFSPTLELSQNNLSGSIWKEFGNLKQLHLFNLSSNSLTGSIPSSLSEMTSLEVLDLANNSLSGSIPESLQSLTFLSKYSVANNNLSGIIPSRGQFETFPNSSFEGNHLCGYDWQCGADKADKNQPRFTESGHDNEFALNLSYGVALGFGLSFVIVAFRHCWMWISDPTLRSTSNK